MLIGVADLVNVIHIALVGVPLDTKRTGAPSPRPRCSRQQRAGQLAQALIHAAREWRVVRSPHCSTIFQYESLRTTLPSRKV